jgi:hyperosmotically inducible periplasmic protein
MKRFAAVAALCWSLFAQTNSAFAQKASSQDDQIDFKVRTRLAGDPDVKGGALDVSVKDGVVVLKGRVDTAKGKNKATKLAKKVKGVKSVDNELTVGPPTS